MNATQEQNPKMPTESDPTKMDRNAPAGTPNSLGAESIRDGRRSTDDSVVEAMDEKSPGLPGNWRFTLGPGSLQSVKCVALLLQRRCDGFS